MADVLKVSIGEILSAANAEARALESGHSGSAALVDVQPPDKSGDDARSHILAAVLAMMTREVAGFLPVLSTDRAAAVLREQHPSMAMAALFSEAVLESTASTSSPISAALLAGSEYKRGLLAQADGVLTTAQAATHLQISRQAVDKRRVAGTLLGVRMPSGEWVYPAAQFGSDGESLPGVSDALKALRPMTPWMQLEQLLVEDEELSEAKLSGDRRANDARSALRVLRDDGPTAIPAVLAVLSQASFTE